MESGVYKIVCTVNGREYIGSSSNIKERFKAHKIRLSHGSHRNKKLQNDWNEFGCSNFEFTIIEYLPETEAQEREMDIIASILPYYNTSIIQDIVLTDAQIANFVSKIVKLPNGCWIYNNNKIKDDYILVTRKRYSSHRVSYTIFKGKFNKGLFVCHTCNNKYCCNPEHLKLQTSKQNTTDAIKDGLVGRLTQEEICFIRSFDKDVSHKYIRSLLLEKFGKTVSKCSVGAVRANKMFKDENFEPIIRFQPIDSKIIKELRRKYLDGETAASLSEEYNIKIKNVYGIINNKCYRDPNYTPKETRKRTGNDIVKTARDEYCNGDSVKNIAERYHIKIKTMYNILRNHCYFDENYTPPDKRRK